MQTTMQTPDRSYFDAIATCLPDWQVQEDTSWNTPTYQLVYAGTDPQQAGAKLYAHVSPHKIMWTCGLHIPYATQQHYVILDALSYGQRQAHGSLEANISLTKCPANVARELQRRLLPRYLALYATGMARVAAILDQHDQDDRLAHQLAAILGTKARHQYNQTNQPWAVDIPGVASIIVEHGGIRFTHHPSFTADQATQLCTLFATWQRTP